MRLRICLAFAALALVVAPGSGLAGEGCRNDGFDVVTHIFETSDVDGNGTLSRAEYDGAGLARYGVPFEGYDANGDGEASLDEYQDLYDRHHPAEGELES